MVLLWVTEDEDDGVSSQEHLGNKSVLVHRSGALAPLPCFRYLRRAGSRAWQTDTLVKRWGSDAVMQQMCKEHKERNSTKRQGGW